MAAHPLPAILHSLQHLLAMQPRTLAGGLETPNLLHLTEAELDQRKRVFMQSFDHPVASRWMALRYLAQGGTGQAGLWAEQDPQGKVIQRVVVKEVYGSGSVNHPGDRINNLPKEVFLHTTLSQHDHSDRTLKYLAHTEDVHGRTYRLFTEYCPLGDLDDYIIDLEDDSRPGLASRAKIPDPAMWYFLLQLMRGLSTFENSAFDTLGAGDGSQGDDNDGSQDELEQYARATFSPPPAAAENGPDLGTMWMEGPHGVFFVHKDIKPGNIFLTTPDPDFFPRYPRLKLADFGGGRFTSKYDSQNPNSIPWRRDVRTPGYQPPEIWTKWDYLDRDVRASWATPRTNLWQVGVTMKALMTLGAHTDNNPDWALNSVWTHEAGDFGPVLHQYSTDFQIAIEGLSEPILAARPDVDVVTNDLELGLSDHQQWRPGQQPSSNHQIWLNKFRNEDNIHPSDPQSSASGGPAVDSSQPGVRESAHALPYFDLRDKYHIGFATREDPRAVFRAETSAALHRKYGRGQRFRKHMRIAMRRYRPAPWTQLTPEADNLLTPIVPELPLHPAAHLALVVARLGGRMEAVLRRVRSRVAARRRNAAATARKARFAAPAPVGVRSSDRVRGVAPRYGAL